MIPHLWSFLCHIIIPCLFSCTTAKEYNSISSKHKSFYPKHKHDIFYDSSKVIPEDVESDVFLYRHHIQKLFFMLEGGYRPISVTVTPCSTEITLEWKISHSTFQNSGSSTSYHSGTWSNHVIRPPSSSPAAAYVGRQRRSYTNPRAPPGLYTLEFRADVETRVKVLVTTRPTGQMPFHPPLPPESGVQIVKIKRNRILISWKPSLSGRPVEYCVSSNNRGNYNSLCSASSDVKESTSSHTLHSASYHHVPASHESRKNGATLTCVGRKTWHLFKGLQRGRTYYFDVFVLDMETNASSTYTGVSATVRNVARHPSRLKDDSLVTFSLDPHNGYAVHTKYHPGKTEGPVLLFIQSCTGPGPVTLHISQNSAPRKEVLTTSVMDVKTLEIPRQMAAPGNNSKIYSFSILSSTKHNRKVRMWISGKRHAFPFPVLPQDKSVNVFDTLTTCDSITIGWKASPDEKVKYCIYRQAAFDELMERTLTEPQNFCEQPTEGSSVRLTVLCRRYHKFSKRRFNNVIMQRVRGLHPGTTYLFEVQVTKVKGKMLPYEHVWATTLDNCSNLRTNR